LCLQETCTEAYFASCNRIDECKLTSTMLQPCDNGPHLPRRNNQMKSKTWILDLTYTTSQRLTGLTRYLRMGERYRRTHKPTSKQHRFFQKAKGSGRKALVQEKDVTIPTLQSGERDRDVVSRHEIRCEMGHTGYGRWAELTERLVLLTLHLQYTRAIRKVISVYFRQLM
jgi:hypothetical protein